MTVPVQVTFTASIANGLTTVFPYSFKITSADDIAILLDGVVVTTGFTISGIGEELGGNVTFAVAPENGVRVVRALSPILKRVTDYQQFGDWFSDVVNNDFDRIWLALQSLAQNDSRAIKLPIDTADDQVLAGDGAARANKSIKFDGLGNVTLTTYDPDSAQADSAANASAAASSASDASSSASNAASSATSAANSATAAANSATSAANSATAAANSAASVQSVNAATHAATAKATPADADEFPLIDSAASYGLKKFTWSNIKAALASVFMSIVTPGASGNVLTSDGTNWTSTAPTGAGGPAFSAYQSSAQTPSANTWSKVSLQSKDFDTANKFDNTTNFRFTPDKPGYYQVNAAVAIGASSGLYLQPAIYKNGAVWKKGTRQAIYGAYESSVGVSCLVYLNGKTDYIEFWCNPVSAVALVTGSENTYMQAVWVRS